MDPVKYEQMLDILARSSSNFDERVGQRFVDVSGVNGYYNGDGINVGLPVGQLAQMGIDAITGAGRPRGFVSTDELAEQFANVADDVFRNPQTGEPDPNRRMFIRGFSGTIDATGQNITYAADRQMTVREFRDSFLAEVARANGGQVDPEVIAAFDRELAERGFGPQTVAPIETPNRANAAGAGEPREPVAPTYHDYEVNVLGETGTIRSTVELSTEDLAAIQTQMNAFTAGASSEDKLAAFTALVNPETGEPLLRADTILVARGTELTLDTAAGMLFTGDDRTAALAAIQEARAEQRPAGAAPTTQFVANPALGTMDMAAIEALQLNEAVAALLTAPTITFDPDGAEGPQTGGEITPATRMSAVFQAMTNSIEAAQERPLIEADQTRAREAIVQAAQQRPLAAGETREAIVQAAQEHTLTEEEIRGVVVQDARNDALGVFTTALQNPQIAGNVAHIYQTASESERAIIDAALEGPDGLVTALGDPMGTRLQEQVEALQADAERRRAQVEGREPTPGGDGGMNFFQGLILMIVELVGRETPFGQQLLGMVDPEHRAPRTTETDAPAAGAEAPAAPDAPADSVAVTGSRSPELAGGETDVGVSAEILRAYDPDSYEAILGGVRASNSGVDEISIVSLAEQQYNAHLETVAQQLDGGETAINADGVISVEERAFIESKRPDFDRLLADNAVTLDAALQTASADIASVGQLAVVDNSGQRRETGVVLAQG